MPFKFILKFSFLFTLMVGLCMAFAACSILKPDDEKGQNADETLVVSTTKAQTTTEKTAQQSTNDSTADTYVILDDSNTIISGNGAAFDNSVLTISKPGTYSLTGTLSDGKIYVDSADETKKVKIIFDGVSIYCSTDAPFFVENSPKETIIILAEGSSNFLSDSARTVPEDENAEYATAVIYSKDDLQIEGSGSLTVTANFNKGIFSKNDVDIRGGNITVTSIDDGIRGKDSVEISSGTLCINAGGDGIRTSETLQESKGDITVSGGKISITSELDGIQATANVNITGGEITVKSGGGATGNTASQGNEMMPGGMDGGKGGRGPMGIFGGRNPGRQPVDSSSLEAVEEDTPSMKGIKADKNMSLTNSKINISSLDDSIHAVNITVEGGTFSLSADDDGIHADETVSVESGDIRIQNSYEGIEGKVIEIDGGNIILKSSDDGFNAASGDSSGGMGMMHADESCKIIMTGGYVHIDSDGDGIDSNGNVDMSGGTLIVFGPEGGGNSALDYAGAYTVSGGTLLALGSAGMAQSVTGKDDVGVIAFNYSQQRDVLMAITDNDEDMIVGFKNTKSYSTVVFASDDVDEDESYNIYYGGSIDEDPLNGVYLDGDYSSGTLVGFVSS